MIGNQQRTKLTWQQHQYAMQQAKWESKGSKGKCTGREDLQEPITQIRNNQSWVPRNNETAILSIDESRANTTIENVQTLCRTDGENLREQHK